MNQRLLRQKFTEVRFGFYLKLITTQKVAIKRKRKVDRDMSTIEIKTAGKGEDKADWLEIVRRQVASLRYGVVQIVVHDSQVTQIEKTERVRLDKSASK